MSSNKYFRKWEINNSSNSKKSESDHLKLINKLDGDIDILDRAIDKITTEKKAKKIFALGTQPQTNICYGYGYPTQQVQMAYFGTHPIQLTSIGTQYIMVNGCVIIPQSHF